ncbi:unnamed protein product, partial [Candidula unifasciata]
MIFLTISLHVSKCFYFFYFHLDLTSNMTGQEDVLRALGCIVKMNIENIAEDCSACGILLSPSRGIILSHGSILTELCLKDKSLYSSLKHEHVIKGSDLHSSKFEVLIDDRWSTRFESTHPAPIARESSDNLSEPGRNTVTSASFIRVKCVLLYAFRNADFAKTLAKIMPDSNWTFTTDCSEDSTSEDSTSLQQHDMTDIDENNVCFNLLSYFLLLKIAPLSLNSQNNYLLSSLRPLLLKSHNCQIGDFAEIVATPFGSQNPLLFFNSFSRGVVCNVSGTQGCWILTDARCIPGSEGGPLFTGNDNQTRRLSGIIAASLCWKNKEWIGFSLACSLNSIYSALDFYMKAGRLKLWSESKDWIERNLLNGRSTLLSNTKNAPICKYVFILNCLYVRKRSLLSSTVAVRVGSTWGSGIIVDRDKGIILTCGHVVKDSHSFDVQIKPFQGSPRYKATLVYSSSGTFQKPYDIAILKCPQAVHSCPVYREPRICSPKLGERVFVVGHALFSTELDLQPSLCAGVIAKVVTFKGQSVMIQSTCAVHAGASGGPLLNTAGDLVGIVVCNTVDKGSNSSYPHINMSIPAVSVWPIVQSYLQTG